MKLVFFAIACLSIAALAGCGTTPSTSNTAQANKAAPANTNTAPADKAPAKPAMKAADVTPDKTISVDDLVDGVVADPNGWKGKEVAVSGYVYQTSDSGDKALASMSTNKEDNGKAVTCSVGKEVPDEIFNKTVEVKGTISVLPGASGRKIVSLDPCQVKK